MDSDATVGKRMSHIDNYWSVQSATAAEGYINTEEVELFLNGESLGRVKPDSGRISSELKHPPFTFNINSFEPGTLRAVGYLDGQQVAETQRVTPADAAGLSLKIDESGKALAAGQKDVVFVYTSVVDENGTTVPKDSSSVSFQVEGDAELIGQNPINAEAGIATILLRAGDLGGTITIMAESDGLGTTQETVTIHE